MERKSRSLLLSMILVAQVLVIAVPQAPLAMASQADNPEVEYSRSEGASLYGSESGTVIGGGVSYVPALSVTLPWGFPFYGKRYYDMSVSQMGAICLGIDPESCLWKPIDETTFKHTTMIAPAWGPTMVIAAIDKAPDLSWVRVRWTTENEGVETGAVAFDAFLYHDGRIRFDYGPDATSGPGFSGISSGSGFKHMIQSHSPMKLDFAPTVTFRPVLPGVKYVWIDQPLPGDVWVNGARRANLPGLSHAIVVGWVPIVARSSGVETVTLRAGSEELSSRTSTVQYEWHPATSTAMVTLTAETSTTKQLAAIDVQVLGGVEELLQYSVDIVTPLENDLFVDETSVGDNDPVVVPVRWRLTSRGCPAEVSFSFLKDGDPANTGPVKTVRVAASNTLVMDTLNLQDSDRMRLIATITPEPTCLLQLSALGQVRAVGDESPPFIVDSNCRWVKVETSEPETVGWLTSPPTVEGATLRTACGYTSSAVSADTGQGESRILFPIEEFEGGFAWETSAVYEPYGKDEIPPPPQGDAAKEFSTSATEFELLRTGYDLPMRQGETVELWALTNPLKDNPTSSPTALVEVYFGETLVLTGLALDAWTPLTGTIPEDVTVNSIRITVSSPTSQPLRVALDGFLTHAPAALVREGERAASTISTGTGSFMLHYSLDMTPPTGTASFRSNGGWIPLMPGATPGGPAQAYATLLPVGVDEHSGVADLDLVGDDGQVKLVKYETQVPWTFTVPWDGEHGVWVTKERRVNVTFIDEAGIRSDPPVPATVTIDGTYPVLGNLVPPASGWFSSKTPLLQVDVSDVDSGMSGTGELLVGSTSYAATVVDGVLTGSISVAGTGTYTVTARARDVAGNVAERAYTVKVDVTPPRNPTLTGPSWTRLRDVLFSSVTAIDDHSGMQDRRVGEDIASAPWEPYVISMASVTLSDGDGRKTVHAEFRDKAGNTATTSRSLILDTRAPIITPVSPAPGSTGNRVLGLEVKATWADDLSATQDVSGVDRNLQLIYWTDGATGERTDVTNDPKMTITETGFTFRPVVLPGQHYVVEVQKNDRAGNAAANYWEFWT